MKPTRPLMPLRADETNVVNKPGKADEAKAKAEEAKGHDQAKSHG
jgi:hypothetical protein